MANMHTVSIKLNGKPVAVSVEPRELLIHTLREKLAHTGPHIGCETSHCGACTVDIDGMSVKSCTVLTVQCDGAEMLTVEGLEQGGVLHALQQALSQLSPEESELMQEVYVDERSLGEVARESGQSYKAIESRVGRLRLKLRTNLLKYLRHEENS